MMNNPSNVIRGMYADVSVFNHHFVLPSYTSFADLPEDLVAFREDFLREEAMETMEAMFTKNHEEALDGLIDLAYVALGTLYLMGVNRLDLLTCTRAVGITGISHLAMEVKLDHSSKQMLIDLVYSCREIAISLGWNFDEGWRRVHEANMMKIRVQRKEDSKRNSTWDVVKPEGWQKPSMKGLV